MSDNRPPEGARYKIPDWNPFQGEGPSEAPRAPSAAKPPKMGIEVPITVADFREHWRNLAQYARFNREDVDAFTDGEQVHVLKELGLSFDFKLDKDQQRELDDTGHCTLTLPQVERFIRVVEGVHKQRPDLVEGFPAAFGVDFTEWEELHAKGLVSPHNLSRSELQRLRGIKVFDAALRAMPAPSALTVPLSLEEIQSHWSQLAQWCMASNHDPAKMIDDIEVIDTEKGTRNPWLTAQQRSEIEARGLTYLDIQQMQRMYAAGWNQQIPVESWFALRERGVVSAHHLSEDAVRNLLSVPFFKELYDLKFNKTLIYERSHQQELELQKKKLAKRIKATVTFVALAVVAALGYGGWYYLLKPSQDLKADQSALLVAASQAYSEKFKAVTTVLLAAQGEATFDSIAKAEQVRVAQPAFQLPAFRTEPNQAHFETSRQEAESLQFEQQQFEAAAKRWKEAFIYQPSSLAALHNAAYATARTGDKSSAFELVVLALSLKQNKDVGYWKTWRLIGTLASHDTEEERRAAADAYLVAFALHHNWEDVCKSLLEDGRAFGDNVKKVVSEVFARLPAGPGGRPVAKTCALPPAF